MQNRKWLVAVALVGVLTVVAAGCTKKSNTGGGTSSKCSSDQFKCDVYTAGQPIKIGTLLSITGSTAFLGTDSQHGAQLALDYRDGKFDGTDVRQLTDNQWEDGTPAWQPALRRPTARTASR